MIRVAGLAAPDLSPADAEQATAIAVQVCGAEGALGKGTGCGR